MELTEDGDVFYEAYAFSQPAHALSVIGYPIVRLCRRGFTGIRRVRCEKLWRGRSSCQLASMK